MLSTSVISTHALPVDRSIREDEGAVSPQIAANVSLHDSMRNTITSWNHLPEILVQNKILNYLNNEDLRLFRGLNTSCRTAVQSFIFNKTTKQSLSDENLPDQQLQNWYEETIQKVIKAYHQEKIKPKSVLNILSSHLITQPKVLNLSSKYDKYTNKEIYLIAFSLEEKSQRLEQLNISHSLVEGTGLQAITKKCLNLKKLEMCNCRQITVGVLGRNIVHWHKIEHLNISDCNINNSFLFTIAQNVRYLKSIDISSTSRNKRISNIGIKALSKGCKKLEYINISGRLEVNDESIIVLAKQCNSLRKFYFNNTHGIRIRSIEALMENCANLEEITCKTIFIEQQELDLIQEKYPHQNLKITLLNTFAEEQALFTDLLVAGFNHH